MRAGSMLVLAAIVLPACLHHSDTQDAGPHDAGTDASANAPDGSTPADAATADLGRDYTSDRDAFFGATRCASAHLQFCEDFEEAALDTSTWTPSGTTPTLDTTEKARGNQSLHIVIAGNGASLIQESKTFPEPNNDYWGRMFVYFKRLPVTPDLGYAHWTFAFAAGSGAEAGNQIRLSGQLQNSRNLFGVGTDERFFDGGTGDWTLSDNDPTGHPMAVPTGEWLCIEWLHQGSTNETRFFWDAVEHPSLHTTETMHGGNTEPFVLPKFATLSIGWQEYQATTEPFELWIDEVAVDPQRIGCSL